MLSPLDVPRFTTAQTAAAADTPLNTLAAQLRRGDIALGSDEPADVRNPGTGRSRIFSARRVLHIALTQALARAGVGVGQASKLALFFTDTNAADGDQAASIIGPALAVGREPGKLFADGETVFRVLFHSDGQTVASIDRLASVTESPFYRDNEKFAGVLLIDMDSLVERTLGALGMREAV